MTSKVLSELDDIVGGFHVPNGRSDSCDAIQEVDEEVDIELDSIETNGVNGNPITDEERKAAALRIIRRYIFMLHFNIIIS